VKNRVNRLFVVFAPFNLENLKAQKVEIENQIEQLRATYLKVLGAIDALEQIEEANSLESEPESESEEESEEE